MYSIGNISALKQHTRPPRSVFENDLEVKGDAATWLRQKTRSSVAMRLRRLLAHLLSAANHFLIIHQPKINPISKTIFTPNTIVATPKNFFFTLTLAHPAFLPPSSRHCFSPSRQTSHSARVPCCCRTPPYPHPRFDIPTSSSSRDAHITLQPG